MILGGLAKAAGALFSGGAKDILEGVGELADRFITTDEDRLRFLHEAEKLITERMKARSDAAQAQMQASERVMVAELQSGDPYVSRTRPMLARWGLYTIMFNYAAVPLVSRFAAVLGADVEIGPLEMPTEFWVAWGGVVGTWTLSRGFEKASGTSNALSRALSGSRALPTTDGQL